MCTNTNAWRVDWTKQESLNNWVQQLDLYCTEDYKIGLFGSMFFAGAFIGSFILPRLADMLGRRPVYLGGLCLYAATAVCYPFSTSLTFNYILVFLGGISESARYYVGFVFLQELMPKSMQTYSGLMIFIVHAVAKIVYDLTFYKLTKNWVYIGIVSITFVTLSIVSVTLFMPESPRYLFSKGKVAEARQSFHKMASINNWGRGAITQEADQVLLGDTASAKETLVKVSVIQYVKSNRSFVLNILIMMLNWSCSSFCFYLIPYFLSNLNALELGASQLNVFQLSLAQYTGELFACFFSVLLAKYMPSSKLALAISHTLSVIAALIYLVTPSESIGLQLFSLFLCKFGVTSAFNLSYTIMRELFETLIRATSFGVCNVTARLITISAPIFAQSKQPIPMLIIVVFSAAAGGLSLFLRPLDVSEKKGKGSMELTPTHEKRQNKAIN
ncbi:hypothetical protein FGO68_gene6 [Halteria grandinella]|uniref:Major facilitator superfamily (MFS) profile domain-containing protein n=1 Tax=Halteria grandinella TaxID=5974 RepID=A0A8J8T2K5_HALGN|nr:hypothetical protein FGO68_gene6 [Halteria grandinella]